MTKKIWHFLIWLTVACVIIASAFVLFVQIGFRKRYEVSVCNQYSMVPTINLELYLSGYNYTADEDSKISTQVGDYAVLDTHNKKFKVGDIVSAMVNWPLTKGNEAVVKRLVGLPNDKIKIEARVVEEGIEKNTFYDLLVNDKLLYSKPQKEYIGVDSLGNEVFLDNRSTYYSYLKRVGTDEFIQLGENEYFILGDNWESSYDSMDEGCGAINFDSLGYKVVYTIKSFESYRWELFKMAFTLFFEQRRNV